MQDFTPYVGLTLCHPTLPYEYTIVDIDNDTLKCQWLNLMERQSGYCKMNVNYAQKALTTCTPE